MRWRRSGMVESYKTKRPANGTLEGFVLGKKFKGDWFLASAMRHWVVLELSLRFELETAS
jgi:hypothetical protein